MANFEGLSPRECDEHRTTGQRAWCFADSEWCYPDMPCRGCELGILRVERDKWYRAWEAATKELQEIEAENHRVQKAFQLLKALEQVTRADVLQAQAERDRLREALEGCRTLARTHSVALIEEVVNKALNKADTKQEESK